MDFRTIVTRLAATTDLDARTIVKVADALSESGQRDLRTFAGREDFARSIPDVREAIHTNQKILAIKALRSASVGHILPEGTTGSLSLRDSKDVIDLLFSNYAITGHI